MAVTTRKCTRCGGTGLYPVPGGQMDTCWGCGNTEGPVGCKVIRTGEDKKRYDADMAFVQSFLPILRRRAMELAPNAASAGSYVSKAKDGLWALAKREPERLTKLRASVEAGRLDDVIRALYAYATQS